MKENKLREIIQKIIKKELTEDSSTDAEFAKAKLEEVNKFSRMLLNKVEGEVDLPEWVMEKIIVAAEDMNEVFQYFDTRD